MKTNRILGIAFLALQLVLIGYARFIPERFFCWAPFDEHTRIKTSVRIDHKYLTPEEIKRRYHYQVNGWEVRDIHNVFDIIKSYEETYGKKDNAQVIVNYSVNGHSEKEWTHQNMQQ